MPTQSKTADQIREDLSKSGFTIKGWSEVNGFKTRTVEAILRGERKGYFGIGHKIAVALGLKLPSA